MSKSSNDYGALEQEYIQTDISVRALAEKHSIAWSAVNVQKNKREWDRKREEFRAKVSEKSIEIATDKIAQKIVAIREDALTVIQASIRKMGMDLRDRTVKDYDTVTHKEYERMIPGITVTPSDITKLITSFQTLIGQPGTITENRNLGITLPPGLDPEFLRALAEATGEPDGRAAVSASLPGPRSTGPN